MFEIVSVAKVSEPVYYKGILNIFTGRVKLFSFLESSIQGIKDMWTGAKQFSLAIIH